MCEQTHTHIKIIKNNLAEAKFATVSGLESCQLSRSTDIASAESSWPVESGFVSNLSKINQQTARLQRKGTSVSLQKLIENDKQSHKLKS